EDNKSNEASPSNSLVEDLKNDAMDKVKDEAKDKAKDFIKDKAVDAFSPSKMKELVKNKSAKFSNKVTSSQMANKAGQFISNNATLQAVKTAGSGAFSRIMGGFGAKAAAKAGSKGFLGKGIKKVFSKVPYIGPLITGATVLGGLFGGKDEEVSSSEKVDNAFAKASEDSSLLDKVQDVTVKAKGVVSSKEESSIESDNRSTMKNISEGARNILDNTPNLIKIPGGILLAHQLYERILSPAL